MFAEPERIQAMAGLISAAERKFVSSRLPLALLGMEGDSGKRVHGDAPIAVVLLDRLVDDDGRIIGKACFDEERIERAEVGRDEIVGALGRHGHERRVAGLRGRHKSWRSGLSAPPPLPGVAGLSPARAGKAHSAAAASDTGARRRRDRPGRNWKEIIGRPVRFSEDNPSLRRAYFRFFAAARQIPREATPRPEFRQPRLTAPATRPADGFSALAPWRRQPSPPAAPSRKRAPRFAARARARRRIRPRAPRA